MTVLLARPVPWARARPTGRREAVVLGLAGLLFVGVFALRMSTGSVAEAYSMLYTFPVALVATYFGLRAGAAAGVLGVALVAVWGVTRHIELSPVGWASRVLPLLLLGVLLGEATDRMRRTESERRHLVSAALLHREAIEINDSIVQGITAAKWSLEAGNVQAGLAALESTLARAQELVSDLIRRADMGDRAERISDGTGLPAA